MKTYHAASMHHLLSSELLQSQESVSQVCDRLCPFCQREYERPIDLQHHVAGHLESTTLLSLPNLDNIDEDSEAGQANSNSANRNYAESRAGDFDSKEPLGFLENDLSGDIPSVTEMKKELFRRKLKVESVPFDSMNELSVEARQEYSSDLAGEWLSRLPIELGEEGELLSEARSEPLSKKDSSPRTHQLLNSLNQLHSYVHEKCEDGDIIDFYDELYSLQEVLHMTRERSILNNLSQTQMPKTVAALRYCEDVLTDVDKIASKYGSPEMKFRRTREKAAQKEIDTIRSRLLTTSSTLGVLNALYVTPARTPYEVLTFCRVPSQVKDGAVGSREDLESSGQSETRSILANLIVPGLSAADSEGERRADDPMNPTSIPMSFNVTGSAKLSTRSKPHKRLPDYQGTSNSNHWLPKVFNQSSQSLPITLEENPDRSSACFGEHMPEAMAMLDSRANVTLAEFRFQNDQFIVRLCYRPRGYSSRILCSTKRPARRRRDSWESLVALTISRRDSLLKLTLNDGVEEPPGLWACIRFPDYQSTFIRGLYLGLSLRWWSCYSDSHYPRGLQKA